jgi:DNA-directed RNA polymerase sigma subunit (sigma70/sigma32)
MITARESVSEQRITPIDGFMKYLSEISKYPMKDYLSEVDKYPVLTEEEEQTLAEQVYNTDDEVALEKLVFSNLRLVAKIALECCDDTENLFDPADDGITALYRWSIGAAAPAKALTYRRALPAVASA